MKKTAISLAALALLLFPGVAAHAAPAADGAQAQTVTKAGTTASVIGAPSTFTGHVRVDLLSSPNATAPYSTAYVTFDPGARTFWHTHPAGQTLIVVAGVGLTGTEDGNVVEIRPGDVVWCPENVRHWHGATPSTAMTHLCVTGDRDGSNVTWMEPVSDEQYSAGSR